MYGPILLIKCFHLFKIIVHGIFNPSKFNLFSHCIQQYKANISKMTFKVYTPRVYINYKLTRIVHSHINEINKMINDDNRRPYILTFS